MDWWPWLLFAAEIIGISSIRYTAKTGKWWGWLLPLATMTCSWAIYSITTRQWGFTALTALWATTYIANARTWKRKTPR